jgi:hypothetical protein
MKLDFSRSDFSLGNFLFDIADGYYYYETGPLRKPGL